jgi:hypothetical protein
MLKNHPFNKEGHIYIPLRKGLQIYTFLMLNKIYFLKKIGGLKTRRSNKNFDVYLA